MSRAERPALLFLCLIAKWRYRREKGDLE